MVYLRIHKQKVINLTCDESWIKIILEIHWKTAHTTSAEQNACRHTAGKKPNTHKYWKYYLNLLGCIKIPVQWPDKIGFGANS